jgi:hypothetical protein
MPIAWQGFDHRLTGQMLLQVGDLVGLTRLDLSSNRLEALPTALTHLTRLQVRGVISRAGGACCTSGVFSLHGNPMGSCMRNPSCCHTHLPCFIRYCGHSEAAVTKL